MMYFYIPTLVRCITWHASWWLHYIYANKIKRTWKLKHYIDNDCFTMANLKQWLHTSYTCRGRYECAICSWITHIKVNSVVEANIPTIILFCVIHEDVDYLYKWQTFWPSGLHQSQIPHVKSGSDEGRWTKTSAIYINNQHLCRLRKKEESWERSPRLQN